jgi:putative ABC transport system permease protein
MKPQDFRVGLRILAKDPAYSLVAILGLGVGLGMCLLMLGYARYSWQYNAHVPDADNVYIVKHRSNLRLGTPWFDQVPMLLHAAAETAPGVKGATAYVGWAPITLESGGQLRKLSSLMVMPDFDEMMGLRAIDGDLHEALSRPDGIAITNKAAIRLFGTSDVVGRTVLLRLSAVDETRGAARIAAIIPDPPANTTIPFEALYGPNLSLIPMLRDAFLGPSDWMGYLLVRVDSGASVDAITADLQQALDEAPSTQRVPPEAKERLGNRRVMDIELSPLRAAYFDRDVTTDWLSLTVDRGDPAVVAGLVIIAVLLLALVAINYINLLTIRVVRRQREIAMRKVVGASKARLALQFAAESMLVSLVATSVGVVLAWACLPVFSTLMDRELESMLSLENIAIALTIGLLLGLVTAIYPAWIAFGVRPSLLLMGRPDSETLRSKRLRQALSVLQVSAAMGLASFTLAILWQTRFAMNRSPGFDPSALLVLDLPRAVSAGDEKPRAFMAALSQRPEVAGIAVSNDPIGRAQELQSTKIMRDGRDSMEIDVKSVSANFFEEYGIRPQAGRLFDSNIDKDGDRVPIVINAIAARQLGFALPDLALEQPVLFNTAEQGEPVVVTKRIIGIAPEIRFYSLREPLGPIAYELTGSGRGWAGTLTVRAAGSIVDAERAIRELWPGYFPNSVVEVRPAKEPYVANYADDARIARLLGGATLVAMVIAAFGVYVLAADSVQRRTKEIALRKLFGGRGSDVAKLVAKDVGTVIVLSAVIALPLAALAIARYLAGYTEWTSLAYWALACAPILSAVIAALAGARQAWIAMTLKPAVALRH